MKKIIGVLGVAVIAVTMFFSANGVNGSSTDTSLASLIAMNTANAEGSLSVPDCDNDPYDVCYNNSGTGYINCDPSIFWDTCGD